MEIFIKKHLFEWDRNNSSSLTMNVRIFPCHVALYIKNNYIRNDFPISLNYYIPNILGYIEMDLFSFLTSVVFSDIWRNTNEIIEIKDIYTKLNLIFKIILRPIMYI